MSDAELRDLERTARERSHDLAAGRAYAHALARVGERRGEYFERCRLARLGDRESRDAVQGWSPWPGSAENRNRSRSLVVPLRRPPVVTTARVPLSAQHIAAVSPRFVLLRSHDQVVALEPTGQSSLWRRGITSRTVVSLLGDDVICAGESGLVVVDGQAGVELRSASLERNTSLVSVEGDRAIALRVGAAVPGGTVVCLDLGPLSFGRCLWSRPYCLDLPPNVGGFGLPDTRLVRCADGLLHVTSHHTVHRCDIETGNLVGQSILSLGYSEMVILYAADDRGVLCSTSLGLEERDLSLSQVRWRSAGHPIGFPVLGEEVAIRIVPLIDGVSLTGVARGGGATLWTRERRVRDPAMVRPSHRFALAGDVLYSVLASHDVLDVAAFDVTSGAVVFVETLPVPPDTHGRPGPTVGPVDVAVLDLAPGPECLLILTRSAGRSLLIRLG